jgi:hypothetical protein
MWPYHWLDAGGMQREGQGLLLVHRHSGQVCCLGTQAAVMIIFAILRQQKCFYSQGDGEMLVQRRDCSSDVPGQVAEPGSGLWVPKGQDPMPRNNKSNTVRSCRGSDDEF